MNAQARAEQGARLIESRGRWRGRCRRIESASDKTVNNVLTALNLLLKKAVEWNETQGPAEAGRHEENPRGDILETADA